MLETLSGVSFSAELTVRRRALRLPQPLRDPSISDARPPSPDQGAPLRRLVRSRGVALQLELLILAWAQGPAPDLSRLPPLSDPRADLDLVELIASPAVPATGGRQSAQAQDKRARGLRNALTLLDAEGLVQLDDGPRPFTRSATLLREEDDRAGRVRPRLYSPPAANEDVVVLPAGFITNGWHYCLDPSEILLYLMVRDVCQRGGDHVTADTRLRSYAINKDMLLRTKLLESVGLITVDRDENQRPDGTVKGYGEDGVLPDLQRWSLEDDPLGQPAHATLADALGRLSA